MPSSLTSRRIRRVFMTTDTVGGVWSYVLDLTRGFIEAGDEVFLAIIGSGPDAVQRNSVPPDAHLLFTNLPLDWTAISRMDLEYACEALALMAAQVDADIAHLHAPALVGRSTWKIPVVAVAHSCVGTWWEAVHKGSLPADLVWRHEMTSLGLRRADAVIAPSHAFGRALHQLHGHGFSVRIVNNGRYPAARPKQRHRNMTVVVAAGRLWDEGKNFAVLDECASLLGVPILAAGPLAGPDGSTRSFSHLRTQGMLTPAQMQALYECAGVFVSTSVYEPFGLAALEAAMAGLPLVLSDIPTFREIWGGSATFCPPYDARAFAAAVNDVLSDPMRRKEAGRRARRRAARYTAERMVAETAAVHADVMNRHLYQVA